MLNCKVVTVQSKKGGAGKTTLCINLAAYLSIIGQKVLLIDADPQISVVKWAEKRQEKIPFSIVSMPMERLYKDIKEHKPNYDCIIIDGPPGESKITRSCMMAADAILVPCTPSRHDLDATADTLVILEEVLQMDQKKKCALVLNRVRANTIMGKSANEDLQNTGVNLLKTVVHQREDFPKAAYLGYTVIEKYPASQSAIEISELYDELRGLKWVK